MAGLYCCLTVRFLLWSTTKGLSLHSTGVSPEGWWIFNRSLYFFSLSQRNWTASREDCLQRNADLVVINTKGEEVTEALSVCVYLRGYIRHSARCVFITAAVHFFIFETAIFCRVAENTGKYLDWTETGPGHRGDLEVGGWYQRDFKVRVVTPFSSLASLKVTLGSTLYSFSFQFLAVR